ncbi:MAG: pyridoxamine 5'-phosphate oxidase family protein [Chloroflexi bacterium]|nr:MAG: pyridoxamine 5'-phosphate oxidase family protein [Chloroflexota bacterium]TMF79593.1 MAG: pyridoxamine 5'-phosphate oxidase family protein [Chloroflexota bacterium]TMF94635.1 MAG: pyridoxamine 5'-phosphate oxidase family protein [Chloroflexota bacterium]TMG43619.1 MAG: pyridoxamine 5'-phosphate oxidase family protein [Chloroflexota bacterium]
MRDTATRKADVLAALEKQHDLWLASADVAGRPHLIAVSAWWDGTDLIIATTGSSKTARNLAMNPAARVARGAPADAIVIDAQMIESRAVEDSAELAGGFAAAVGWDPREVGEGWMFFRLRPNRIQAFRGYDEIEGRDVMLRSRWLV